MPTISVIVPVYKVEAYLDRCVQSVLKQTYTNFELILVDDGSPDNCGAMCDAWAQKDTRIRVIHKTNGGLSDARNVGFEASTGEWITFIDSDDYVHPQMLEALYDAVMEHDVKVSICGYTHTTGEPLEATDFTAKVWKPEDFYLQHNVNATVAWGKLYHRNTVLLYPKGKLHEDEYITYRILFACKQIAVVAAPLYGYFLNQQSITKQKWNPKRMDAFEALEGQVDYFRKNGYAKLAHDRAWIFWGNIKRQITSIFGQEQGFARMRYLYACRRNLRRILRKYRCIMGINLLDHCEMYEYACPALKWWYRGVCKFRVCFSVIVRKVLGNTGIEKVKHIRNRK